MGSRWRVRWALLPITFTLLKPRCNLDDSHPDGISSLDPIAHNPGKLGKPQGVEMDDCRGRVAALISMTWP